MAGAGSQPTPCLPLWESVPAHQAGRQWVQPLRCAQEIPQIRLETPQVCSQTPDLLTDTRAAYGPPDLLTNSRLAHITQICSQTPDLLVSPQVFSLGFIYLSPAASGQCEGPPPTGHRDHLCLCEEFTQACCNNTPPGIRI